MNHRRAGARREYRDESITFKVENNFKDYANFLGFAPLQLFNLKPNEAGVVSVNLKDLKNFSQVYFVAVD